MDSPAPSRQCPVATKLFRGESACFTPVNTKPSTKRFSSKLACTAPDGVSRLKAVDPALTPDDLSLMTPDFQKSFSRTEDAKGVRMPAKPDSGQSGGLSSGLELLCSFFDTMLVARSLLGKQNKQCTGSNIREIIQQTTKRQMLDSHIQQIKTLLPEAFTWRYIKSTDGQGRNRQELLLAFPQQPGQSTTLQSDALLRSLMQQRAADHMRQGKLTEDGVPPVLPAPLPPRSGSSPRKSALLVPSTPDGSRIAMPETPGGALPPSMQSTPTTATPASRRGALQSSLTAMGLFSPPVKTPAADSRTAPKLRRLEFATPTPARPASALLSPPSTTPSPAVASTPLATPQRLTGRSLLEAEDAKCVASATPAPKTALMSGGRTIPLSQQMLQVLQMKQDAAAADTPLARQQRLRRQQATQLPSCFNQLRSIFGAKGPCSKPREEVAALLAARNTLQSGMSRTEAEGILELMAMVLPSWITLEPASGRQPAGVRINRAADQAAASARCSQLARNPAALDSLTAAAFAAADAKQDQRTQDLDAEDEEAATAAPAAPPSTSSAPRMVLRAARAAVTPTAASLRTPRASLLSDTVPSTSTTAAGGAVTLEPSSTPACDDEPPAKRQRTSGGMLDFSALVSKAHAIGGAASPSPGGQTPTGEQGSSPLSARTPLGALLDN